ncbi:MAG TPA: flagellar motor protein MotA [Stellaceae bacterium]|nr:flagellar motor protein MotA [Stellaceae bacterium]
MTRPQHYLARMAFFVVGVAVITALLSPALYHYFMGNPAVNGLILLILVGGIIYIFRQVLRLNPEVAWIEGFRRNQGTISTQNMPRLLSPMATMLADRRGGRVSLSATSMRTLLDGIATRLDETRETSRYLIGLLVFLGLLGTFYGLLETVQSVGGVIGGLSVGAGDAARAFNDLKSRLEAPLGGMGTAFSASLFGLSGSLVLGFLDLQAGLAQNRFYNDLEEWLSSYTRLSGGGPVGEGGEASVPAFIQALLEQTADSLENLQRILGRGEESRISANANLLALTERLSTLTDQMRAEQTLLLRLAEQQVELKPILSRLADATSTGPLGHDETRGHLRNIEVYIARLSEDISQGRGEATQEIRSEIRLLARTIAALAEDTERS